MFFELSQVDYVMFYCLNQSHSILSCIFSVFSDHKPRLLWSLHTNAVRAEAEPCYLMYFLYVCFRKDYHWSEHEHILTVAREMIYTFTFVIVKTIKSCHLNFKSFVQLERLIQAFIWSEFSILLITRNALAISLCNCYSKALDWTVVI